jgi:AcrR family transcriptional regulator
VSGVSEPQHVQGPFSPASSAEHARLREAAMQLIVERGWAATDLGQVLERAGIDHSAFEREFTDLKDCCFQIYIAGIAEFDRIVFAAVDAAEGWPDRLRAAAYAAVRYVQARPLESRFNFIEMLEGGERAQVYRDRYVNRIVDLIDEGRACLEDPDSLSREVAVSVFGSIYLFIQGRMNAGADLAEVDGLVPDMMFMAVLPYVGAERAEAERTIPPPPDPDRG